MGINQDKQNELENLVNQAKQKEHAERKKNKSSVVTPVVEIGDVVPPPTSTPDMFYGLVGEVARIASNGTEVNPVSAAMVFLSFLGANVGRDTYLLINNTYHHPRLFTLHIGRSSRGGKGDSQQLTHRIRQKIEELEPDLLAKVHTGGLSTGEGLAAMLHDGYGETPPIHDKRLWVVEGELANVLNKMRREGNSLSTTLREVWDGSDIKPAIKTKPMGVTNPHIGIHVCITPTELTSKLGKGEMDNGFANRFLMAFAENIGCVPFPTPTAQYVIDNMAIHIIDIVKYSLGNYPDNCNNREMNLSDGAKVFYEKIYRYFKQPLDNELVAGLLARRAPYTVRLSMLFALCDKSIIIEEKHLKAAFAWVEYGTHTVRFVFHSERQTEKATQTVKNANKILEYLNHKLNGCSSSEITTHCFKGNLEATKIKEALHFLLSENPPVIEQIKPNFKQKGRPKITYKIKNSTKKTKKFTGHEQQGVQDFLGYELNTKEYELNTPNNENKSFNSYSFVTEKEGKQGCSPCDSYSFVNSLNSYPVCSEESDKNKDLHPLPDSII